MSNMEYGNGKKQNMSSLWELGLQLLQYLNMIYGSHIDKSRSNFNGKVLGVFTWVNGNQGYGFTSSLEWSDKKFVRCKFLMRTK